MSLPRSHARPAIIKELAQLVCFDEACRIIAASAMPLGTQRMALEDAGGHVLATDVVAQYASPPGPVSAMDGYAVRDHDLQNLPVALPVAGKSFAGKGFDGPLPPGSCVRIFTGAPAPEGTERVVMQEDVRQDGTQAVFLEPLSKRRHLRQPGADFRQGDVLVREGSMLTPQRLIGAAAADCANPQVFRKPRVAILCCGDELAAPGDLERSPHAIPESISYGVAALARQWGGIVVDR